MTDLLNNTRVLQFAVRLIVLFTAFPVHESAHGLVAHWLGDDTAKNQGRISLNPMRHITLWGGLFMLFVGVGAATPVPINPNNFKNRKVGMALSSLAGPVSNLLLAYISMLCYRICVDIIYVNLASASAEGLVTVLTYLCWFFSYASLLNVGLAVFNLLPIPPLDGSRIVTIFLSEKRYFSIMKYEKYIMMGLFAVIFAAMYIPALADKIYAPLEFMQQKVIEVIGFLCSWVDLFFII